MEAQTCRPAATPSCCAAPQPVHRAAPETISDARTTDRPTVGMRWIPPGDFTMGAVPGDRFVRPDERPAHRVTLGGFWIDATPVTNAQFRDFAAATKYVTTAERAPVLAEIMAQLPPGTPPPPAEVLVAGSMVFRPPPGPVPLDNPAFWWAWVPGADWRHPQGPASGIGGRDEYPVVQVSWDDAAAYARWAGKRLPTEAEWERAARGGVEGKVHWWGDSRPTDDAPRDQMKCNIWQGRFPYLNTAADGYAGISPVTAFGANGYGLRDMAGNVWQWCADWYRPDAYRAPTPAGPAAPFDPDEPTVPKRVMRGGSYLCHASYCASYRASARMKSSPDSATTHVGFRCASDAPP